MQSKHIAEEWLGSCLYFQNADYCLHPAGLVFFSEHSRDVSPKVAPWRCDPWPSVGDPTRCGVCAGTVARGSSVSRGEALSPQTATESMARGVLSAPLSIILPPRLSLSTRSLALFLSHSFIYTVSFFLLSLILLDSLSNSVFPPCFCIPLPPPPFPQMSSFPLGPPTLLRLQSPSSPPSVLHTFTFPTCCFSSPPLLHWFHLYLPPLCAGFKYEGVFKSSFRLTKQTRWKNNATAHFRLRKEKHISWSITPTESDLSLKDVEKWPK